MISNIGLDKETAKFKSSIANAVSYQEMGEFWDKHDLAEVWDRTEAVEFSVNITSERSILPWILICRIGFQK